jgi:hypothetical protein
MRFYATNNPANGAGSAFIDVAAGSVVSAKLLLSLLHWLAGEMVTVI